MLHFFAAPCKNWLMKKLLVLIAVFALFGGANCYAEEYVSCPDIRFVFARGSGAPYTSSDEFLEVVDAINSLHKRYSFTSEVYDLNYSAVAMNSATRLVGAFVSAGKAYSYGRSVRDGVRILNDYYDSYRARCPDMKWGFIGYSQGATVVANVASSFDSDTTAFVLLLGDPETYLPEGRGLIPRACTGGKVSSWRTYVPNCHTHKGVFGGRDPYEANNLTGKYSLWCLRDDYICGSSKNPLRNSGHTSYVSSGSVLLAMSYVTTKYLDPIFGRRNTRLRIVTDSVDDDDLVDEPIGSLLTSPEQLAVWRDGDTVRIKWVAVPSGAKYLLIRLNGVDLGYVDSELLTYEIRDVDFDGDNNFEFAWMEESGELSDVLSINEILDEEPEFVADFDNNSSGLKSIVADGPLMPIEPIINKNDVASSENDSVINNLAISPPVLANDLVLREPSVISEYGRVSGKKGINYVRDYNLVTIIVSVFGAGGLVLFLMFRRRHG